MIIRNRWLPYCAGVALFASSVFAQVPPPRVQTFPLLDAAGMTAPRVKAEGVTYLPSLRSDKLERVMDKMDARYAGVFRRLAE